MTAAGELRAHWQPLMQQLQGMSPAQLAHRQDLLQRQIQENGVTYNIYADAKGADRPWELDLLPQLIPAAEWNGLAAGIAQRAGLLDRVLADLYGPQQLLRKGLLPSDLIFGHNNFLWPCHGITPAGGRFLHVYAADLARAPDGRWWVVADRTQVPSGAGYALENRQIITRTLPELHRQQGVQPISGFFRALRNSLTELAPHDGEAPLAVVLTPGRYNETYFEHLYLARHLGLPLVEGQDLTVRGDTLYLKAVSGLRRVHGVLRRLDDDFCDPLELRSDSALGVPGLLNVVRAGRVLLSNALGSGVVESPGLMGFLPAIAGRLLGEPLQLPQLATWWCGEAGVLEDALARLPQLVIKPAFPSQSFDPVFAARLDAAEHADLARRIRAMPGAYVAQEQVQLSQAPVLRGEGGMEARAIGMRVFAVATADGYRVLPGGLTRVAGNTASGVVSMQRGGASKDTWVLSEGPQAGAAPDSRVLGVRDIIRRESHLPSRVVENLFWFGRYSERCDTQARLLRGALLRLVDNDGEEALATTEAVGDRFGLLPLAEKGVELPARLLTACLDSEFGNSLPVNLQHLYNAAAPIRGRLSQENWQAVAALARQGRGLSAVEQDLGDALALLSPLVTALTALSGFALDDMTRDVGWRFLMLGRRLERLQFFAGATASVLASPALGLQTCAEDAVPEPRAAGERSAPEGDSQRNASSQSQNNQSQSSQGQGQGQGQRNESQLQSQNRLQGNDGPGSPVSGEGSPSPVPGERRRGTRQSARMETLDSLLLLANSLITYRSRYQSSPELLPTLDLLLLDPHNPHSLVFQLGMIEEGLEQLREEYGSALDNPLAHSAARLRALDLSVLEPSLFGEAGQQAALDSLVDLLEELGMQAGALSDRLGLRYFVHADQATSYGVSP
ncbi:MAG: Domain of uncharacterized function [Moraxellaceae bacterium]|nr:Domain of uncharacterized function [Moraxellaceae bacterium]